MDRYLIVLLADCCVDVGIVFVPIGFIPDTAYGMEGSQVRTVEAASLTLAC